MFKIIASIAFLIAVYALQGQQVCEGSLGNNIFSGGDFGIGSDNILQINPGIAPGYLYTTNPPPSDGYYNITNNTGQWSNLYPTWLEIEDNSDDPNGYMMVVNASFEPGIFYEEIITGLCENTFYEFSADIINMIKAGTPDHIDPNVDFLLDGAVKYSTGTISKSEKWNKYGFTFTTDSTQSEIKLTLRNNAPGGIGNDLALDNISFRPCGPKSFIDLSAEETVFLCLEDDPLVIDADIVGASGQEFSLFWQESSDGVNWNDMGIQNITQINHDIFIPGNYYYRYISAANDLNLNNEKCRIISDILNIEVLPRLHFYQDTICEGSVYDFNGQGLTSAGIFVDTLLSSFGCDSVVTLDLRVIPALTINAEIDAKDPSCNGYGDGEIIVRNTTGGYGGYSFVLNGNERPEEFLDLGPGKYELNITDRYGCNTRYEIELDDPDLFTVDLGADTYLRLGEELNITPESNYDITQVLWEPSEYFTCNGCSQTIALPLQDGYISVTAFNDRGCIAQDSFFVSVDRDNSVFIPNIFSPNDDGLNDIFEIKATGRAINNINKFQIIDRWGGVVYTRNNIGEGDLNLFWDGKVNGRYVSVGVYTYILEIDFLDGTVGNLTGDVTIVR